MTITRRTLLAAIPASLVRPALAGDQSSIFETYERGHRRPDRRLRA